MLRERAVREGMGCLLRREVEVIGDGEDGGVVIGWYGVWLGWLLFPFRACW